MWVWRGRSRRNINGCELSQSAQSESSRRPVMSDGHRDLISVPTAYAGEGQDAGPLFVTERAGLFAAEDLDVKIRLLEGAKRVVRGLLDGEVLFGNLAAPALVEAAIEGAPVVYITGGINQQFLVGRPGLTSVQELTGGRIG